MVWTSVALGVAALLHVPAANHPPKHLGNRRRAVARGLVLAAEGVLQTAALPHTDKTMRSRSIQAKHSANADLGDPAQDAPRFQKK